MEADRGEERGVVRRVMDVDYGEIEGDGKGWGDGEVSEEKKTYRESYLDECLIDISTNFTGHLTISPTKPNAKKRLLPDDVFIL